MSHKTAVWIHGPPQSRCMGTWLVPRPVFPAFLSRLLRLFPPSEPPLPFKRVELWSFRSGALEIHFRGSLPQVVPREYLLSSRLSLFFVLFSLAALCSLGQSAVLCPLSGNLLLPCPLSGNLPPSHPLFAGGGWCRSSGNTCDGAGKVLGWHLSEKPQCFPERDLTSSVIARSDAKGATEGFGYDGGHFVHLVETAQLPAGECDDAIAHLLEGRAFDGIVVVLARCQVERVAVIFQDEALGWPAEVGDIIALCRCRLSAPGNIDALIEQRPQESVPAVMGGQRESESAGELARGGAARQHPGNGTAHGDAACQISVSSAEAFHGAGGGERLPSCEVPVAGYGECAAERRSLEGDAGQIEPSTPLDERDLGWGRKDIAGYGHHKSLPKGWGCNMAVGAALTPIALFGHREMERLRQKGELFLKGTDGGCICGKSLVIGWEIG